VSEVMRPLLATIVTLSPLSFSRHRRRSRDNTEIGRSWCTAKWRWWPRMGIFWLESAGSTVSGLCSCGGSLSARGVALTPRHFFTERALEGGSLAWRACTAGHRAYSGSARAVREAYMNPLISLSLPSFFAVRLYSQQPVESFSTTSNHFHALEMATFAFKPQYTYKPTAPRSKSTATRRRPAPRQVSTLNKLQDIMSSGASFSTLRPVAPAAAAADDDGGYRPGIRGM